MKKIVLMRLSERLKLCMILSSICTALNLLGVLPNYETVGLGVLCSATVFIAVDVYLMKECYMGTNKDKEMYLTLNLITHIMFVIITILVLAFAPAKISSWVCLVLTVLKYCQPFEFSPVVSALIFHTIELGAIIIVPFIVTRSKLQ